MRAIYVLFVCLSLGLAGYAQTPATSGQPGDCASAYRHKMYRGWQQGHRNPYHDSLGRTYRGYAYGRGQGWQNSGRGTSHRRHDRRGGQRAYHPRIAYTPQQRKQLQAINAQYHQKAAELFKNDNLTLQEYKAKLLALERQKKAQVQGLLTPEQKTSIAKQRAAAQQNAQVRAAAHLERLKIDLQLSDQQVLAIKSQQENMRTQILAIRASDNLLATEKRDQIHELAMKRKDALKTILTPEQFSEMQTMHTHRFSRS
jgi:hypothetical protein